MECVFNNIVMFYCVVKLGSGIAIQVIYKGTYIFMYVCVYMCMYIYIYYKQEKQKALLTA